MSKGMSIKNGISLQDAERMLRDSNAITVRMYEGGKEESIVDGKRLLDTCGIKYTSRNWTSKISRIIDKHKFLSGIHYVKINAPADGCIPQGVDSKGDSINKGGKPAVVYFFSLKAASHALMCSMTQEGEAYRDDLLESDAKKTEALIKSSEAHVRVTESDTIEDAKAISSKAVSELVRSGMLLGKPSHRLRKAIVILGDIGIALSVKRILEASMGNKEADFTKRERFSKSLLAEIGSMALKILANPDKTSIEKMGSIADLEIAKGEILKYQLKRCRQKVARLEPL